MAKKGSTSEVGCSYGRGEKSATPIEQLRPMFETRTVTGRPITSRFNDRLPIGVSVASLTLFAFVNVVRKPSPRGGYAPIRDQAYVDDLFDTANEIWSQACIKLVPVSTPVVTTFLDLPISAFAGTCLAPAQVA